MTFMLQKETITIRTSLVDPCLFRRIGDAPSSVSFFALGVFGLMAAKATRPGVLGVRRAFRGDRLLNLKNYFRMLHTTNSYKIAGVTKQNVYFFL